MDPAARADTFAAVDLGSNSFHLLIARREASGALVVVDRLREMVRLAAGLGHDRRISAEARERALACLRRFGQRLREVPPSNVRAVGTDALRRARDARDFVEAAAAVLDHPVEIVSGMEEARLIYLGVAHDLAQPGPRLVLDIGGGSTELIVGADAEPLHKASLEAGCVGLSERFFAGGDITAGAFAAAELAARVEIEPLERRFRALGWRTAVGASGTIRAVAAALRESGWTDGTITAQGLERLRAALVDAGDIGRVRLPGVRAERYPVFPGGVAILRAAFDALGIEAMRVSEGALREGLLLDLIGRFDHADVRATSVERLAARFHADAEQAARVAATADALLRQAAGPWDLGDDAAAMLRWAARLHEIGLDIDHAGYHRHGAYIVENTDLAGFSRDEQRRLAALVRAHRRKLPRARLDPLDTPEAPWLVRTAVLLRLAVLLHRGRSDTPLPAIALAVDGARIRLASPRGWLGDHPLTRADLEAEREYLEAAGFALDWEDTAAAPAARDTGAAT